MDHYDTIKKLSNVNWNFDFSIKYGKDNLRPFNSRKYFSYPATFIPEIPYTLIEILSQKGDVVLDPFGGIGTTFFQALLLERNPYTFDINIITSSACKSLFLLFDPQINRNSIRDSLLALSIGYDENLDYVSRISDKRKALSGWFESKTFNELSFLFCKFDHLIDEIEKSVSELVLSSILTTLSSQKKGWAYIADNVKPKADELKYKNVFSQYKSSLTTLFNDVNNYLDNLSDSYSAFYAQTANVQRIFDKAIISCDQIKNSSVDLIITSPPYPKMIDYIKSQRLSFYFSEKDFHDYMAEEIGARYRRTSKDGLENYSTEMQKYNEKMAHVLKEGGFLCLILPDFPTGDKRRVTISNMIKTYDTLGFTKIYEVGRYIPSHKRTLSIQWASLVNETILVFQKG